MAAARAAHRAIIAPPLWKGALPWIGSTVALAYLAWLWVRFGLTPELLWKGISRLAGFIVEMLPPDPCVRAEPPLETVCYTGEFLSATGETLGMAFLGTLFAALIAFPLAFLGASNVVPNRAAHFIVRRFFDMFRGIPSLIWALIFVASIGLGPMAGVLALMMSDFAALAKLGAETIENADRKPVDGVTATGATRLQILRFALVPQVLPVQLSQALYFFESNVRSAAVLGIVGAGGIGYYLSDLARNSQWSMVAFILVVFLVLVAVIDAISKRLRSLIVGERT
ncbi:MAG: phosphonate ABC transporter, permease protein PhnE [Alphaproteobacteria bacterium]|nr:phosphonate ABC transporter, permease protein PhnE [Alphaproteobacteria bacterium]